MKTGTWQRSGSQIVLDLTSRGTPLGFEVQHESRPTLRRGSSGASVTELQRLLGSLGYSPGPIDGIFGSMTDGAVRTFQRASELLVDGIVGPATWAALAKPRAPSTRPPSMGHPSNGYPSNGYPSQTPGPQPVGPNAGAISLQRIQNAMRRLGYVIYTQPYRLNIVGVRNPTAVPDSFDDSINVFYVDNAGKWIHESYPATVDPGLTVLLTPYKDTIGAAILEPGQYVDAYQIGLHKSSYTALVQRGPVTVIRDGDRDRTLDFGGPTRQTGLFGINIHRANATGTSPKVGEWSAGCQVIANPTNFAKLIALAEKHRGLYGNTFTYTLLRQEDV